MYSDLLGVYTVACFIERIVVYERLRDTLAFRKILVRGVCVTACCMKKIAIYECPRAAPAFRKILVRDVCAPP